MTIEHHPVEELLAHFAAGRLEQAEHIVIAAHTAVCERCRMFVTAFESIGGDSLAQSEPAPLASGAFADVMARLDRGEFPAERQEVSQRADIGLPSVLRNYTIGQVRWVAPGVSMQPIAMRGPGRARAFLLRSAPGTRMLEHTHTETELTCVLQGSFDHEGGHFGPGDFDLGDPTVAHRPVVGTEGACICLVALTGRLRINGLLGRIIDPFIRL